MWKLAAVRGSLVHMRILLKFIAICAKLNRTNINFVGMHTMLRIAICDDEEDLLPVLKERICLCFEHYQTEVSADTYNDGLQLREVINSGIYYDIIFLDVDMPNCDGIKLGTYLIQVLPDTCLIFVSNKESSVFRSFAARPFRFVRKSCFDTEMPESVGAAIQKINAPSSDEIVISSQSDTLRINPLHIIYLKSSNNYVTLFTKNDTYTVRRTLNSMESDLSGRGFIRLHQRYLVNYRYIYRLEKTRAVLDNQTEIPISRNHMKSAKETFQKLMHHG